jgi:acylphosphatase
MLYAGSSYTLVARFSIGHPAFSIYRINMISLQIFYEGNVQGVGFRWSVRYIAKGFDVTGWVRNLLDGRVELQVNGDEDEVRAFLDAIAQSELRAHIRKQTENKLGKPATVRGFEIRHD